jgi:hypothetical protein
MPHPSQRRKAYRPRPVSGIGGITAIAKRHDVQALQVPMNLDQAVGIECSYRLAFEQLTHGQPTEENWAMVTFSLNMAIVMADQGLGQEYTGKIAAALEGASRARMRGVKTGRYGLDGPAITAILEAFAVHDEQIRIATKAEVKAAINEMHRRMDAGICYREVA